MVGTALKKLASEMGLKQSHGVIYGVVGGYMCTFTDGMDIKTLGVSCAVSDAAYANLGSRLVPAELSKQYRIKSIDIQRESITFVFFDTIGTIKKIRAFLEEMPRILYECGAAGDGVCTSCGNPIASGEESNVMLINGVAHRIHSNCLQGLVQREQFEKTEYDAEEKHTGRGFIGALLGSIIGAVPWALVYLLGFFAAPIGALIGWFSKKGYELAGGCVCKAKTVIVLISTVLGVIFGQFLGDAVSLAVEITKEPSIGIGIAQIPQVLIYLFLNDSEFTFSVIKNLALALVFGLLGAVVVLKRTRDEHKTATIKTVVLE